MRKLLLAFAFANLLASPFRACAGLVSTDALMFFSGGDFLPDRVPNRAIYDAPADSSKILRVTAEVASAYWSLASGLLERGYVPGAYWPYSEDGGSPSYYTLDDFKTNTLVGLDVAYEEILGHSGMLPFYRPECRSIESARLLANVPNNSTNYLWAIRSGLRGVANCTLDIGWGYWDSVPFGSTWFDEILPHDTRFPSFAWTNEAPCRILSDAEWACVWPQFTSCPADGIWKTAEETNHGGLYSAICLWDDDETRSYAETVLTNATPATCFGLLTNRLGAAAVNFTNETRRLSYYQLGSLQAAVGAMDRTYVGRDAVYYEWNLGYTKVDISRSCSSAKCFTVSSNAVDTVRHTIDLSAGGSWSDTLSVLNASTNSFTVPRPFAGNYTSNPRARGAFGVISGGDAALGAAALDEMVANVGEWLYCEFSVEGDKIVGSYSNGWASATYTIEFPVVAASLDIEAEVFAGDSITIAWTDNLVSNKYEELQYPSAEASRYYRPSILMNTLESAGYATNWCESLEYGPGYFTPHVGWTNYYRSVRYAATTSRDAVLNRYHTARRIHCNRVVNYFADYHGMTPSSLAESIKPPTAAFARLKADVDAVKSLSYSIELQVLSAEIYDHGNGLVEYRLTTAAGTGEWVAVEKYNLSIPLGGVAISSGSIDLSDDYPDRISPFEAHGTINPILDLRWTFRNLGPQ